MKVYVCYEENNHELAIECGAVTDMTVFATADGAAEWFAGRVFAGKEEGFILDFDDDKVKKQQVSTRALKKEIKSGYCSLTMFRGYQENWDESYAICVYEREVQ